MIDLKSLSLFDYITNFGSIDDQDHESDTYKERIKFKLWKRQMEACDFMEKIDNRVCLLPKSRQKGYSEIAAERSLFTLFKHKNIKGVIISKSEDFAKKFLSLRIVPKYNQMMKMHPGQFPAIVRQTKEEIEWEDGRVLTSISCSSTGAASLTLDFMVFDEAGGIDEGRGKDSELFKDLLTNSMPALDQNQASWAMIIGTSVPGTYYNELVRTAYDEKNTGTFKYFFIGWHHQPGRDQEWYLRQKGLLGEGVYLQHPTDMEDFFYVKDGLVFHHFDSQENGKHIKNFDVGKTIFRKIAGYSQQLKPSWNMNYITSYDHGTNHPAANLYILYDKFSDMMYVFAETFFEDHHGSDVSEIAEAIHKELNLHPKKPNRMIADGAIFNEIGVESVGKRFGKNGLKFKKAKKNDEAASRDLLASRFKNNTIIIHRDCYNLIDQIRTYRWDVKSKGEKPIQKNDDAIDALRYGCAECKSGKMRTNRPKELDPYLTRPTNGSKNISNSDPNAWMKH